MKLVLFVSLLLSSSLFALKYDRVTGLVIDRGLDDVKENCTVCHPGRFIVVNGGGYKFWKYKIEVMQKGFGLWDIDKEVEDRLINYLAKNYSKKVNVSVED